MIIRFLFSTRNFSYKTKINGVFSTHNIGTLYYCHHSLATAILGQSITVSTDNSKVLNNPLKMSKNCGCAKAPIAPALNTPADYLPVLLHIYYRLMHVNHTFVFLLCLAFSEWLEDLLPFCSFLESLGLHFLLVPIRTNVRKIFNNFTFAEIRWHLKNLSVHTHTIHMFRQHSVFFFLALVFVILWTTKYGFFHSFIDQHVTHF